MSNSEVGIVGKTLKSCAARGGPMTNVVCEAVAGCIALYTLVHGHAKVIESGETLIITTPIGEGGDSIKKIFDFFADDEDGRQRTISAVRRLLNMLLMVTDIEELLMREPLNKNEVN